MRSRNTKSILQFRTLLASMLCEHAVFSSPARHMKIPVKVTPNARTTRVLGWEDDPQAGRVLRVRLQAPPVDGKANKALVAFLAKEFGVAKSGVKIVKGETSRMKLLEVPATAVLPD